MQSDFRQRVLLPIMLPLVAILALLAFAFSLSRVMLAISEFLAVVLAIVAAAYILVVAAFVSARPRITSRALAVGVAIGLAGVVAAGALAGAAGMRELEHGEEVAGGGHAEPATPEEQPAAGGGAEAEADAVFVAVDIDFSEAPETLPAGELVFLIENEGNAPHNVAIEELGDEIVVEANGGNSATGQVTLDPGTYTYYCSVPGHRAAGMEGTLTVQ